MSNRDFEELWATQQLEQRTRTLRATQTLKPPSTDERIAHVRTTLPPLFTTHNNPQLTPAGTLGVGGMGVINLARQVALRRDVAVKQLLPERRDKRCADELLREGWLVGGLEHPNIVPIYLMGEDDDGMPALVMKRIEGHTWSQIRRGVSTGLPPSTDPLRWNLEVLMDVCNALHFAHSKGIVHRDLKPENVMIGNFGEVYLLDWGIAVSMSQAEDEPLPRAIDANHVAGTPAYMAPEMTIADGSKLGPHTDIYLVGAVLHELLTGEPPHQGDSPFEMMFSAYQGKPFEYDDVPGELAAICAKAMQLEPNDRFRTALELREAVADFLSHREASALAEQGRRLSHQMKLSIAEDDERAAFEAFDQAKFAFDTALAAWASDAQTQAARAQLVEDMLAYALRIEDLRMAERLIAEQDHDDEAASQAVEALKQKLDQVADHAERYQKVAFDLDRSVAAGWRAFGLALIAAQWGAVMVVDIVWGPIAHLWIPAVGAFGAAVSIPFLLRNRDKFLANQTGWRLSWTLMMSIGFVSMVHFAGDMVGMARHQIATLDALMLAAVAGAAAMANDTRLYVAAVYYTLASVVIASVPARYALTAFLASVCITNVTLALFSLQMWWAQRQGKV